MLLALWGAILSGAAFAGELPQTIVLSDGWKVQSSANLRLDGRELSQPGMTPLSWYDARVPSTIVNVLLENGVILDPFPGMNLRSVPGTNYAFGVDFFTLPMPPDSPFRSSWWYRTEIDSPAFDPQAHARLNLDGINYAANIWINGAKLADSASVAGTYRSYQFDITPYVNPAGGKIAIAIEVFAPQPDQLSGTWVDWNPVPGDKGMGLYRQASISFSGPVTLDPPWIDAKVSSTLDIAAVTAGVELKNEAAETVSGRITGSLDEIRFEKQVSVEAGKTLKVRFESADFSQLIILQPRLWWPIGMGSQELHDLKFTFVTDSGVSSNEVARKVGIREITSEISPSSKSRLFRVNGRPIFVRGGGWAPDLLGRSSPEREEQEIRYIVDLGLNLIRMEGKFETEQFLELCDRYGILVMAGWPCCSKWEDTENWKEDDFAIADASLRSQIKVLRSHPSSLVWLYGSDEAPSERVERLDLDVLRDESWPNPSLASASNRITSVGPTGVKMTGPYDYVPPSYWSIDRKYGGAFGFNTETSVGPAVPPLESLEKMLTPEHLWPIDATWNFHAGENEFKTIDIFRTGLERRYGSASSAKEFAIKSQAMAYDGHRAMFEAYTRQKYRGTTGIIQWMLNNAWPSLIWHLYDYYLNPGGSYFGVKKANEPLHLQYSYDDGAIVLVSNLSQPRAGLRAKVGVYDFNLKQVFRQEMDVDAEADSARALLKLPKRLPATTTYFVKLDLSDSMTGENLSDNFYWLSTKKEVLDWEHTQFNMTPVLQDADLTALNQLRPVRLEAQAAYLHGTEGGIRVVLSNPTDSLAFMTRLRVLRSNAAIMATENDVLPILWSDNYVSLMPGESRVLEARFDPKLLDGAMPIVKLEGWNITDRRIAVARD